MCFESCSFGTLAMILKPTNDCRGTLNYDKLIQLNFKCKMVSSCHNKGSCTTIKCKQTIRHSDECHLVFAIELEFFNLDINRRFWAICYRLKIITNV